MAVWCTPRLCNGMHEPWIIVRFPER